MSDADRPVSFGVTGYVQKDFEGGLLLAREDGTSFVFVEGAPSPDYCRRLLLADQEVQRLMRVHDDTFVLGGSVEDQLRVESALANARYQRRKALAARG